MDDKARALREHSGELRERSRRARQTVPEISRSVGETRNRSAELIGTTRNLTKQIIQRLSGGHSSVHCPRCGQTVTFHNVRTEPTADGTGRQVVVYRCIQHGFYRSNENGPLSSGM